MKAPARRVDYELEPKGEEAMRTRFAYIIMVPTLLGACTQAPQTVVPQPTSITLENAVVQVVEALNAGRAVAARYPERIGLDPCTVQVVFDITASGTSDNKIVLDASIKPPAPAPVSAGVSATVSDVLVANRGNHVTLTLTSPACNPANTLGTLRPERVGELARRSASVRDRRNPGPVFDEPTGTRPQR